MQGVPGVLHLLAVVDVAPHVREVWTLAEVVGGRLQHDVPAPASRPADCASAQRADRDGGPELDAVRRQQPSQLRRVEHRPVGVRHERLPDDLTTGSDVELLLRRARTVGGPQPHGVLDDPGERADRGLDCRVGRDRAATGGRTGDVGDPQQLGDTLGAEEGRDQRLVGLLPDRGQHVGDVFARDVERRDVDRDDRVDLGVVDRRVEGVLEVLGGRLGAQRDLLVDHQTDRGCGVGREQPEGVGVADDRHPTAARQRLVREQLGDVEHLVEGVDLDDPGLAEHRVDGLRGCRDLADRVAHRDALRRTPGPDRDDRLAQRDPARDPGELARVADRLEVEQHDLGRRRPPPSTGGGRCPRRRRGCRR